LKSFQETLDFFSVLKYYSKKTGKGIVKMKFKKLMVFSLIALMSLSVVGCGGDKAGQTADTNTATKTDANPWEATTSGDGSFDAVKKAGKVVVGLDEAYPPMGYRDPKTNELIGFDVDMGKELGKRLGLKFDFQPQDWDSIVSSLVTKRIDMIISGMNMEDDRIDAVNFVPYGLSDQVIIVKKDYPDLDKLKTIDDYKAKVLGTQLGGTAATELQNLGFEDGKNLKLYKSYPDVDLDLENGRVDALAIDSFSAKRFLDTGKYQVAFNLSDVTDDGKYGMKNMMGIAIRKSDGDLQNKIQETIDDMLVDGTMKEISMKWLSMDITEPLVADAKARIEKRNK
jgi:amino acid ABC transporter, amino acid-binding protein